MIKYAVFIILKFSVTNYSKRFQSNTRLMNMVKIKPQFHTCDNQHHSK